MPLTWTATCGESQKKRVLSGPLAGAQTAGVVVNVVDWFDAAICTSAGGVQKKKQTALARTPMLD